ncbi:MAG: dienelactone hydrolase family protein [Candidatus Omnitrophica bacterium]|nr:dienelactone hydrolase family protein [Candidatus Omnitrophota bacterium]
MSPPLSMIHPFNSILLFVFLFASFSLNACATDRAAALNAVADPSGGQRVFAHEYNRMRYWIFFPKNYGLDGEKPPLIMFLHGASQRGASMASLKQYVTQHFLTPLRQVDDLQEPPFILVAPQCPKKQYWNPDRLHGVLQDVLSYAAADRKRLYLTGFSMGGFGTWNFAAAYPKLFAAIVPVSGGGKSTTVKNLVNVPVWAFHGKKDRIVSSSRCTAMVKSLERAGGDVKMTLFPQKGHLVCQDAYGKPELWEWLFSHENHIGMMENAAAE